MPKLRKHSNLKQNNDEEQSNLSLNSTRLNSKLQESNNLLNAVPLANRKIKYSQRVNLIKQFQNRVPNTNSQLRKKIAQQDSSSASDKLKMESFLHKYTDQDIDSQKSPCNILQKNKKKREKDKDIKIKNKLFMDCSFEEGQMEERQLQGEQLLVQRKQTKGVQHLLVKFQKKAQKFKNRLEFKNFDQDHRFKQNMKQKLKSIQGCEEVNLVIQVPKVMAGNKSHLDGALFLKNIKSSSQPSASNEVSQQQEEQYSVPKDRKNFYDDLKKKMKLKKSESITESALKECFKKSKLDDNDFILDLGRNNKDEDYENNETKHSLKDKENQSNQQLSVSSRLNQKDREMAQRKIMDQNENQAKKQQGKQKCQVVETQKVTARHSQKVKTDQVQNRQISKTKKKAKKRKSNKFNLKDLIQEQAQDSDDGGLDPKKNQNQQSQEQDDGDLSSLIDDDVTICSQQQQNIHRKFIRDMIEEEEKKFAMMQQRMHDQRLIQEQQLRKRMEAAAKRNSDKFHEKEEKNQSKGSPPSEEASEQSISNIRNMQKIKQLQIDLGLVKPNSQQNPKSQNKIINKTTYNIQKLLQIQNAILCRPVRNGLKNTDRFKNVDKLKNKKGTKK